MELPPEAIASIRWAEVPRPMPEEFAILRFRSGDQVTGTDLILKEQAVHLKTLWGQEVVAHRHQLSRIDVFSGGSLIARSPVDAREWRTGQGAPGFHQGRVLIEPRLRGAFFTIPPLPESFLVEARFRTVGQMLFHQINLFGIPGLSSSIDTILVQLEGSAIFCRWPLVTGQADAWREGVPLPEDGQWVIRLYVDRTRNVLRLAANGGLLREWHAPGLRRIPFEQNLTIMLLSMQPQQSLLLESMTFREWLGGAAEARPVRSNGEVVRLIDGEGLEGLLLSKSRGKFVLRPEGGKAIREVDADRVAWIERPLQQGQEPESVAGRFRVHAGGPGDRFTFEEIGLQSGALFGSSSLWIEPPAPPLSAVTYLKVEAPSSPSHSRAEEGDLIRMLCGDVLTIRSPTTRGGRLHVLASQNAPLSIPIRHVGHLQFAVEKDATGDFVPDVHVGLFNGDHFPARLIQINPAHVRLDTAWAEGLLVDRSELEYLRVVSEDEARLPSGVGSLSDWRVVEMPETPETRPPQDSPVGIHLGQRYFLSRQLLTRELNEYRIEVEFETGYPPQPWQIRFLGQRAPERPLVQGAFLTCSYGMITHQLYDPGGRSLVSWSLDPSPFVRPGDTTLRVGVDVRVKDRTARLFLNDKPAYTWAFEGLDEEEIAAGNWFSILGLSADPGLHLRDFRVGRIPPGEPRLPDEPRPPFELFLSNGDRLRGEVLSSDGKEIRLAYPPGGPEACIPLDRIFEMRWSPALRPVPRRMERDIIFYLRSGGKVTLPLKKLESGELVVEGSRFQCADMRIPLRKLHTLVFNPHTQYRMDHAPILKMDEIRLFQPQTTSTILR